MDKTELDEAGSLYDHDKAVLEKLGYKQTLDRSLSTFSNFGVTFSCCSILAGLTPLYGDALQSGGPMTVIWVAIASTDLAMAQFLGSLVSMTTSYNPNEYVIFAIYVGILILHGVVNSMAVRLNGLFNNMSVWWHVIGTITIVTVVVVSTPVKQPASWVFTEWVNNTGWSNGFYVFMLGLLQSQYTLSGYDSAAHMTEETHDAQRGGPKGIIMAIVSASAVGWFFLLGITFCITDFENQIVNPTVHVALSQIFLDSAGLKLATFLIFIIFGAQFFCGSALTLSSSRMVYAFARDGALPFSSHLRKLNKDKSPVLAVWFNIAFCFILGLPYIWSNTAYSAIVSVNTIASSISYLIPILCRIILARDTFEPGPFNLGRFSTPVGVVASLWIIVTETSGDLNDMDRASTNTEMMGQDGEMYITEEDKARQQQQQDYAHLDLKPKGN
ncbi:hypothetical protein BGW38_005086 [Lunasporangiospora selenospora]|uniref:Amino acid transporter n=1 Tax=Lunasporangiospora selenospora TaxID=979761 RepID=A0A9P6FP94_9FUNG|nr:hypothetical protein BGW38_005086 [Lunasporangiospora selenospora]